MISITAVLIMVLCAVISYLLGSLSFAVIVSKLWAKEDVRNHGSGNAGMTNILRNYGKIPAAITAAGDLLKAVIAVVISRALFGVFDITLLDAGYVAGLFVLLGHLFPVYFGFKGGKGVVTTMGIILTINPVLFATLLAIFVPLIFITKTVSIGSVFGAIAFPVLTFCFSFFAKQPYILNTLFAIIFGAIVIIMHKDNIKRLLNGTENKFKSKKQD